MILDHNGQEIFLAEAIHPGEMLQDELEARSLTQRELAAQLGVTPAFVNALIHGKKKCIGVAGDEVGNGVGCERFFLA